MPKKKQGSALEEKTRAKIAQYLPDAIDCALQSYRRFYADEMVEDAKAFTAHHTACKTAIAHIELLLKLAAWAHLPRDNKSDDTLAALLSDAQTELNKYKEEEDNDA